MDDLTGPREALQEPEYTRRFWTAMQRADDAYEDEAARCDELTERFCEFLIASQEQRLLEEPNGPYGPALWHELEGEFVRELNPADRRRWTPHVVATRPIDTLALLQPRGSTPRARERRPTRRSSSTRRSPSSGGDDSEPDAPLAAGAGRRRDR